MVRLLICVNILRLSHFRTCLWHFFTTSNVAYTSVSLFCVRVYVFGCACPQTPFNVILYEKNPHETLRLFWWTFMMIFIPQTPINVKFAKNSGLNHFRTCLWGGRAMRASEFVSMTLIGVRGNAWIKHCPPLRGLSTQCPLFFSHFHNIV